MIKIKNQESKFSTKNYSMKKFTFLSMLLFSGILIASINTYAQDVNPFDEVEVVLESSAAAGNLLAPINDGEETTGASFNGEYVFVVSRQDENRVWYWDVSETDPQPQELDLTGVSGGTFVVSDIVTVNNHIIVSNMDEEGGTFKLYHWTAIDGEPQVLVDWDDIPARLGDAISIIGNPDTNARIFVAGHESNLIYYWDIEDGELVSETPEILDLSDAELDNVNFARVTAYEDYFLVSGPFGLLLLDNEYDLAHTVQEDFFPSPPLYARMWDYANSTYLSFIHVTETAPFENTLYVLEVDNDGTLLERIGNLEDATFTERVVFTHDLGDNENVNASVGHDGVVDEDGNLWLFGFAAANGFVLLRLEDETIPDDLIYSITFSLPADTIYYKYFVVIDEATWDLGEWAGDPNRMAVIESDTIIRDVWGEQPETEARKSMRLKQDEYRVTFELDMNNAFVGPDSIPFDPREHRVFIAGSFPAPYEWNQPGSNAELEMTFGDTGIVSVPEAVVVESPSFRLFPNPASSNFTIESHSRINQILISDVTGRTVQSIRSDSYQVNIQTSGMRNGIYIITIYTDSGMSVSKLQVQR
jgi:hypothetical protein